jgi:hypothetical protein
LTRRLEYTVSSIGKYHTNSPSPFWLRISTVIWGKIETRGRKEKEMRKKKINERGLNKSYWGKFKG